MAYEMQPGILDEARQGLLGKGFSSASASHGDTLTRPATEGLPAVTVHLKAKDFMAEVGG